MVSSGSTIRSFWNRVLLFSIRSRSQNDTFSHSTIPAITSKDTKQYDELQVEHLLSLLKGYLGISWGVATSVSNGPLKAAVFALWVLVGSWFALLGASRTGISLVPIRTL
jgi:hypothetical protein